jgi:ribosomal protein S20
MPITKSAIIRARQNRIRRDRLQPYRTHMKTMVRKLQDLVKEGKHDEALKVLPLVYKAIDTASKKNIIHWKTADRRKSSMARALVK